MKPIQTFLAAAGRCAAQRSIHAGHRALARFCFARDRGPWGRGPKGKDGIARKLAPQTGFLVRQRPGAPIFVSALFLLAAPAHASGYLSAYGGSGGNYLSAYSNGGGQLLSDYGSGSYSPGYGNSMADYGTNEGDGTDTPHRATWEQYQQLRANYAARAYALPPCGNYNRDPLTCRQQTLRWNPYLNQ